jgi:predicted small secreted protein
MKVANSKWFSLLAVVSFSSFAGGCATVEGVGEDIQDLGEEIEDEADDARR